MQTDPFFAIRPFSKGSKSYRVRRYRQRAELLRQITGDVIDPECRKMLIGVANTYDDMVAREAAASSDGPCVPMREAERWT